MTFSLDHESVVDKASLLRTTELDEEEARKAGVSLASQLFAKTISIAEIENAGESQPAGSQMIFEANFFAASYASYQAGNWFPEDPLRRMFIEELKGQFALLLAVAAESSNKTEDVLRSEYGSLLDLRDTQYRTIRASFHTRLFRFFLRDAFVDGVFLSERIKFALGEHEATASASALEHFVKRIVREVHDANAAFFRSARPGHRSSSVRRDQINKVHSGDV